MTRDYKPSGGRRSRGKGGAFFFGLLTGLLLGLGAAVGVAWYLNKMPSPFATRDKPAESRPEKAPKAETAKPAVPAPDKPRFDFYKILPGSERPVTERELKEAARKEPPARDLYFLQAGSFQNAADADNLKAKLALLGVEANISTVTLPDKGIWHRVQVGPYTRVDDVNRAREMLKQNGIESSTVKAKEAPQ
ncbi:MAG TPA: SPOR domain-containing protein [Burkholderiales bacterium]